MSVLSFPRIYFQGFMEWDPCTFNNNDFSKFPTYDGIAASLNWDFLATQGITRQNFTTAFRPWAVKLQPDDTDSPTGPRVPCEWNMFGSHGVSFVQYQDFVSTVTGGDLAYGRPANGDPLIGGPVAINGDPNGGPAKLVDSNPSAPWSTQVMFGGFSFGSGAASFSGPRAVKLQSRFLNPFRIYQSDQNAPLTQPASNIGVCFQTCIPYAQVQWPSAGISPLIDALRNAASQPPALGVMIRFTGYVNVYFVNGLLNATTQAPRDYTELAALLATAWDAWNVNQQDTSQFFSNPCYSHIVGAAGVWNETELLSVPGGRRLNMANPVTAIPPITPAVSVAGKQVNVSATTPPPPQNFFLGPVVLQSDDTAKLISVDLSSAMPERGPMGHWPSDLQKADFGPLDLGVVDSGGTFTSIAAIPYDQYAKGAFERSAGIVDIPYPNDNTGALLQSGTLAIQVQGQTALAEQTLTAETDRRAIYLDQGESTTFDVAVFAGNQRVGAGVNVLVARYQGMNADFGAGNLPLIATTDAAEVNWTNGTPSTVTVTNPGSPSITTEVTVVTTDANGIAKVGIAAQSPSFPLLGFYPYTGTTAPVPQYDFSFIESAFYTTVRVLPFDDAMPQVFVDLWNATHDSSAAWSFVYDNILYLYDMIFSVMLEFVNLGNQTSVTNAINPIWNLIAKDKFTEFTGAMPVTRDLSNGKRLTLQLWIYLVANQFNIPVLSVDSIPPGWSPSSSQTSHKHR